MWHWSQCSQWAGRSESVVFDLLIAFTVHSRVNHKWMWGHNELGVDLSHLICAFLSCPSTLTSSCRRLFKKNRYIAPNNWDTVLLRSCTSLNICPASSFMSGRCPAQYGHSPRWCIAGCNSSEHFEHIWQMGDHQNTQKTHLAAGMHKPRSLAHGDTTTTLNGMQVGRWGKASCLDLIFAHAKRPRVGVFIGIFHMEEFMPGWAEKNRLISPHLRCCMFYMILHLSRRDMPRLIKKSKWNQETNHIYIYHILNWNSMKYQIYIYIYRCIYIYILIYRCIYIYRFDMIWYCLKSSFWRILIVFES